jgi:hypothetical protein
MACMTMPCPSLWCSWDTGTYRVYIPGADNSMPFLSCNSPEPASRRHSRDSRVATLGATPGRPPAAAPLAAAPGRPPSPPGWCEAAPPRTARAAARAGSPAARGGLGEARRGRACGIHRARLRMIPPHRSCSRAALLRRALAWRRVARRPWCAAAAKRGPSFTLLHGGGMARGVKFDEKQHALLRRPVLLKPRPRRPLPRRTVTRRNATVPR